MCHQKMVKYVGISNVQAISNLVCFAGSVVIDVDVA
jgi:hypothetical protein